MSEDFLTEEVPNLVGQVLGGYRLTALVGEGGMATVFRGENTLRATIVRAIKVVKPHLAASPAFVRRFTDEAGALEALEHPNVVRFFGLRSERGVLFMELELLEGRTLAQFLESGAVPAAEAVAMIADAADGVAAAHARGMVHRDLKPENVLRTTAGVVKVLDFGLAKIIDEVGRADRATVAGQVPGTPAYMAPEVCEGATPDARADVYALGLTLFEMLTGRHPFHEPGRAAPSALSMMMCHVKGPIPPLPAGVASALPDLGAIVGRATAHDASARYANAAEFREALRRALAAKAGTGSTKFDLPAMRFAPSEPTLATVQKAPPDQTPSRRSGAAMLAGVGVLGVGGVSVVLLLIVGIAGLWWWSRSGEAIDKSPLPPTVVAVESGGPKNTATGAGTPASLPAPTVVAAPSAGVARPVAPKPATVSKPVPNVEAIPVAVSSDVEPARPVATGPAPGARGERPTDAVPSCQTGLHISNGRCCSSGEYYSSERLHRCAPFEACKGRKPYNLEPGDCQ